MIELLLLNHLLADTEVAAIVGDRVFPIVAPLGTTGAYVVFSVPNDRNINDVQGAIYSEELLFQIDCYDLNYSKVKKLKGAVEAAMYKFEYYPYEFTSRDLYEADTKLQRQLIQFKIKT